MFAYDQDITADPALPADMPLGRVFTAHGKGDDDGSYRVYAQRDRPRLPSSSWPVPLSGTDERLNRLLVVESLLIGGVLLVLGLVAWVVVRVGLLPLDRMGHTAGAIAGGDLSHRITTTDPRTEVGRLGIALNAMLDRLEQAFSAATGERGPAAPLPRRRRRTSCAHRSPRSAATPSSSAWAPRASRPRSRRRCAGSRTRLRAWASSSRIS